MGKSVVRRKGRAGLKPKKIKFPKFQTGLNFIDEDTIDKQYPEFKVPWFKYKRSNLSGFKTKLGQHDVIKLESGYYIPYIAKYWSLIE